MIYEWSIKQTTAPTSEPIGLEEAKLRLRVDHSEDDAELPRLISSARSWAESFTGRQIVTASWTLVLNWFPPRIILPRPPYASLTSFSYVDTAGASQTLAASVYTVDSGNEPAEIFEAYSQSWPSTRDVYNAVTIVYVAGQAVTSVPQGIKDAILCEVEALYDQRDNERALRLHEAAERLLYPYRRFFSKPWESEYERIYSATA